MILLYVGADCKISWGACNRKALDSKHEGNKIFDHWRSGHFWFKVKTVKPKNGGAEFNVLQVEREATQEEVLLDSYREFNTLMESKGYFFRERIVGKRITDFSAMKWAFLVFENEKGEKWLYPDENQDGDYNKLIFDISIYDRSDSAKHRLQSDKDGDRIRSNEQSYQRIVSGNYTFPSNGNNTIIIGIKENKNI